MLSKWIFRAHNIGRSNIWMHLCCLVRIKNGTNKESCMPPVSTAHCYMYHVDIYVDAYPIH